MGGVRGRLVRGLVANQNERGGYALNRFLVGIGGMGGVGVGVKGGSRDWAGWWEA